MDSNLDIDKTFFQKAYSHKSVLEFPDDVEDCLLLVSLRAVDDHVKHQLVLLRDPAQLFFLQSLNADDLVKGVFLSLYEFEKIWKKIRNSKVQRDRQTFI